MTKKRKNKKESFFTKKKLAITIMVFMLPLIILFGTQYFEILKLKEEKKRAEQSTEFLMDKMKKMLDEEKKRLANLQKEDVTQEKQKFQKLPPHLDKNESKVREKQQDHFSEIHDYENSLDKNTTTKASHVEKKVYISTGKPKLAIIIDDVAYEHQTKLIKKIPFKVTPSFFPPTNRHPDTISLSKEFDFAMVHLPLQAYNYAIPEPSTLNVGDSKQMIRQRIKELKGYFPQISYYNNHTGSQYTADYTSMDKLIEVLKENNITFIDSRTTAQTKAPEVFQKHNLQLFSRDIFLDNDIDKRLIKEQLLKAVKLAKKHGFSIAIGHPHVNTLEVLKNSKSILKEVDVVYVKDL